MKLALVRLNERFRIRKHWRCETEVNCDISGEKKIGCQVANKNIHCPILTELAHLVIFVDYVELVNIMEKSSTPIAFLYS